MANPIKADKYNQIAATLRKIEKSEKVRAGADLFGSLVAAVDALNKELDMKIQLHEQDIQINTIILNSLEAKDTNRSTYCNNITNANDEKKKVLSDQARFNTSIQWAKAVQNIAQIVSDNLAPSQPEISLYGQLIQNINNDDLAEIKTAIDAQASGDLKTRVKRDFERATKAKDQAKTYWENTNDDETVIPPECKDKEAARIAKEAANAAFNAANTAKTAFDVATTPADKQIQARIVNYQANIAEQQAGNAKHARQAADCRIKGAALFSAAKVAYDALKSVYDGTRKQAFEDKATAANGQSTSIANAPSLTAINDYNTAVLTANSAKIELSNAIKNGKDLKNQKTTLESAINTNRLDPVG